MPRPVHTITPGQRRRWRILEWLIVLTIAGACAWAIMGATLGDDPPMGYRIDKAYPPAGYTCPAGYDGPDYIADNVARCTLKEAR